MAMLQQLPVQETALTLMILMEMQTLTMRFLTSRVDQRLEH